MHKFKDLHIPQLSHALVSFGHLFLAGCDLICEGMDTLKVFDQSNNCTLFNGAVEGCILAIKAEMINPPGQFSSSISMKTTIADPALLHKRAGHPSAEALKLMFGI